MNEPDFAGRNNTSSLSQVPNTQLQRYTLKFLGIGPLPKILNSFSTKKHLCDNRVLLTTQSLNLVENLKSSVGVSLFFFLKRGNLCDYWLFFSG